MAGMDDREQGDSLRRRQSSESQAAPLRPPCALPVHVPVPLKTRSHDKFRLLSSLRASHAHTFARSLAGVFVAPAPSPRRLLIIAAESPGSRLLPRHILVPLEVLVLVLVLLALLLLIVVVVVVVVVVIGEHVGDRRLERL